MSNLIKKQQLFPKKKALNDLKDEREEVNANEKKALNWQREIGKKRLESFFRKRKKKSSFCEKE